MQALDQLDEVLADDRAGTTVKDAASAVRQALVDHYPPDPSLLQIVIAYRAKGQDRYGR